MRKRKRRDLRAEPFPEEWNAILQRDFAHFARLTELEQEKLRGDLRVFIAEKDWEGCRGQEVTPEVQVVIAAQACLLTLCLETDLYPNVSTVLVYPAGYIAPEKSYGPGGIVEESKSHRLGEAWTHGPIVISWSDALAGARDEADGHNVVFHEFAHKLDMRSGSPDGVPRLLDDEQYARWDQVMSAEFAALVAKSETREATVLNKYGATNGAEFFAVATECFFERPREMTEQHPGLYGVLRDYYRQDPAARVTSAGSESDPSGNRSYTLWLE